MYVNEKESFTLIEIIAVIALISIISVSSIIGINVVNKNIKINKLSQITEKALLAAKVYIENNKESKMQIYNNKNGVVIPLNVLIKEGLLTLDNTELTNKDIKDEYIITMLSGDPSGEDCIDLKTMTSWNETSNEPIYICGSSKPGSSYSTSTVLSDAILENAKNASGLDNATV